MLEAYTTTEGVVMLRAVKQGRGVPWWTVYRVTQRADGGEHGERLGQIGCRAPRKWLAAGRYGQPMVRSEVTRGEAMRALLGEL